MNRSRPQPLPSHLILPSHGLELPMTSERRIVDSAPKRIWIDLDNSPHVPFFVPIIKELERRGHRVTITGRDAFQVCELADAFQLKYRRIGRHYGKNKLLKVAGTCLRALELLPIAIAGRPDLAIGHGSRSQMLASALLRIPSLCIIDYEFVMLPGLLRPRWIMVPDVVPKSSVSHSKDRVLTYPGIKEDVYAPTFKPDPSVRSRLGFGANEVVVLLRPPATEAHYHTAQSDELFAATVERLRRAPDVKVVLLPRNHKQEDVIRTRWPDFFASGRVVVPGHVEDGLNLIWYSDLVISGGGTMNREAAALGVPVFSIFRGKLGAVDRYLANAGRLTLLESPNDVWTKIPFRHEARTTAPRAEGATLATIVGHIEGILGASVATL